MSTNPAAPLQPESTEPFPTRHVSSFLANAQYRWLLLGQVLTNTGFAYYFVLLFVWVYTLTRSATAVTGVLVVINVAAFLLGPLAGVFIDRLNRKRLLSLAVTAMACLALLPIFAPASARLPTIYISALLLSACTSFVMPAKSGILQAIVSSTQLDQASYWSASGMTVGYVAGAAVAAPLYFLLGPQLALGSITALFLLATFCLVQMRLPQAATPRREEQRTDSVAQSLRAVGEDLRDGLRFIVHTRSLSILLVAVSLEVAGVNIFNALDLSFVTTRLHVSAEFYGPINWAIGIGTLLGAVLAGVLVKRVAVKRLFGGGILLLGMGFIVYSFLPWYLPALVCIGIVVVPQSGFDVGMGPILINASPQEKIGRIQSAVESASLFAAVIATLLAGAMVQVLGVQAMLLGAGVLVALAGAIALRGLPRWPAFAQGAATEHTEERIAVYGDPVGSHTGECLRPRTV